MAVAKAAIALKVANIIVEDRIDFAAANLNWLIIICWLVEFVAALKNGFPEPGPGFDPISPRAPSQPALSITNGDIVTIVN